jgi:hypothetical protein
VRRVLFDEIETFDTTLPNLRRLLPQIRTAIDSVAPGTVAIVKPDSR